MTKDISSKVKKMISDHLGVDETKVTEEANSNWTASDSQIAKVASDAGMDVSTTKNQMAGYLILARKLARCP